MGSAVSKVIGWCVFVVGLVGAAYGIVSLHVEMSVFWLIVASTSGLILLKMRAEAHGNLDPVQPAPRAQADANPTPAPAAEPASARSTAPSPGRLAQAA
ncbi:MAG TPA: hypothetical protein VIW24_18295 [Aldersonia sp.]